MVLATVCYHHRLSLRGRFVAHQDCYSSLLHPWYAPARCLECGDLARDGRRAVETLFDGSRHTFSEWGIFRLDTFAGAGWTVAAYNEQRGACAASSGLFVLTDIPNSRSIANAIAKRYVQLLGFIGSKVWRCWNQVVGESNQSGEKAGLALMTAYLQCIRTLR